MKRAEENQMVVWDYSILWNSLGRIEEESWEFEEWNFLRGLFPFHGGRWSHFQANRFTLCLKPQNMEAVFQVCFLYQRTIITIALVTLIKSIFQDIQKYKRYQSTPATKFQCFAEYKSILWIKHSASYWQNLRKM